MEKCELCGKKEKHLYPDMVTNSFVCTHCYCHTTNVWGYNYSHLEWNKRIEIVEEIERKYIIKNVLKVGKK